MPSPTPAPLPRPSATPSLRALLAREDLRAGKSTGTGLPPGLSREDLAHLTVQEIRRLVDELTDAAAGHRAQARDLERQILEQHIRPADTLEQQARNTLSALLSSATPEQIETLRELYPASREGACCRFARAWPGCTCRMRWRCRLHGERCEGSHE